MFSVGLKMLVKNHVFLSLLLGFGILNLCISTESNNIKNVLVLTRWFNDFLNGTHSNVTWMQFTEAFDQIDQPEIVTAIEIISPNFDETTVKSLSKKIYNICNSDLIKTGLSMLGLMLQFMPSGKSRNQWILNTISSAVSFEDISNFLVSSEPGEESAIELLASIGFGNFLTSLNTSEQCKRDLVDFIKGCARLDPWVLPLVDSTSKIPSGLFYQNTHAFGAYDVCLKYTHHQNSYTGKYCTVFLQSHVTEYTHFESRSMGLCMPSTCSESDIANLANRVQELFLSFIQQKTDFYASDITCRTAEPIPLTHKATYAWSFIRLLLLIMATTVVTGLFGLNAIYGRLKFFSPYDNTKELLFGSKNEKNSEILPLQGLNTILLAISYQIPLLKRTPLFNRIHLPQFLSSWFIVPWLSIGVFDIFLLIEGYIVTKMCYAQFTKGHYNISGLIKEYVKRYLRDTPMLLFFFFVLIPLMDYLSSGPLYQKVISSTCYGCYKQTWWFLSYMGNLNPMKSCEFPAWYIFCSFQIFLLSPILLYPVFKYPKTGLVWLLTLGGISAGLEFLYALDSNAHPLESIFDQSRFVHTRAIGWFIGSALAVLVIKKPKKQKSNVSEKFKMVLVLMALSMTILSQKWILRFGTQPKQLDATFKLESALFQSCHRILWTTGVAVLLYLSRYHSIGLITPFMELNIWKIIGRLSIIISVILAPFINFRVALMTTPHYVNLFYLMCDSLSDTISVVLWSIVVYLFYEAPIQKFISHNIK